MGNNNDMCDSLDRNKMITSESQRRRHNRNSDNENSEIILCKCDGGTCGKRLIPPYYISFAFPTNPYRRFTREMYKPTR